MVPTVPLLSPGSPHLDVLSEQPPAQLPQRHLGTAASQPGRLPQQRVCGRVVGEELARVLLERLEIVPQVVTHHQFPLQERQDLWEGRRAQSARCVPRAQPSLGAGHGLRTVRPGYGPLGSRQVQPGLRCPSFLPAQLLPRARAGPTPPSPRVS